MNKLNNILEQTQFELEKKESVFNTDYIPESTTRSTTNFANLARDKNRKSNLTRLFNMFNNRINSLLPDNNTYGNRYNINLNILRVSAKFSDDKPFPISEMLSSVIEDTTTGNKIPGLIGFNLSSYIRDYDFNKQLPKINHNPALKDQFGLLHSLLYKLQFKHFWQGGVLENDAIIAISISSKKTYVKTGYRHPILGEEFLSQGETDTTSNYFKKMGLDCRFFMPIDARAPLAIYHTPGDLEKRSELDLASLIAVMETFQKIYRPEIYNANYKAPNIFKPSLNNQDYSQTQITYDRVERESLGKEQAKMVEQRFLEPYKNQIGAMISALSDNNTFAQPENIIVPVH